MKNYIFLIFSVAMLTSCFDKEEDFSYNKNAVVPVVQNFGGPGSAIANGFGENVYSAADRSGSTFVWAVSGADYSITAVGPRATIVFAESSVPLTATVTVTETAANGNSASESMDVDLAPYCPLNTAAYVGSYTGTSTHGYHNATIVEGSNAGELVIMAQGGTPGILTEVYEGWGETYQAGFGEEGNITLQLFADGTLEIVENYWGQTLPGPYDYWLKGTGTYNQCEETLTIDYAMSWGGFGGSTNRGGTVTLSKI